MANYPGRRRSTRRIVIWSRGRSHEWIVSGTKADGAAFEARKRLELQSAETERRSVPRISEFCLGEYRLFAETNLRRTTWHRGRKYQVATIIEHLGELRLTDLSTAAIERFKRERAQQVMASSVNNDLRVLIGILNYARKLGYPVAPVKILGLKTPAGRVHVWTTAELEAIFTATRSIYAPLLPMLVFLANTGCRKGESIAAEWSWVDFDESLIRIPANEIWRPKSGKAREVPMSDAVRAILSSVSQFERKRWVFPNRNGGRYKEWPKDLFAEIRDRAGVTGGPHTFRHTFASHFLQTVPDLFLLSQVLGHSHTRVTELYSHMLPGHLERARNAVNVAPTMAATVADTSAVPRKPRKTAVLR